MRRQSPFKSQNKENSPLSNLNLQGLSQASLQKQRHTIYNPANRNEIESLFPIRSNLSTAKSVSNINLVKVPSMPNSKPLFNVNLTTATEKASEAIKHQNDFTHIFQSYLEKPQLSNEKINDNKKSLRLNVDTNNNNIMVKKTSTIELKEIERAKSGSPQISNSSKPPSRQNSPQKSLSKVMISNAPGSIEDVEMVSTSSSSSNKENNADNLNETNIEPSKLSISEKLKLFSNNVSDSVTIGANFTKKTNSSVQNSAKINFRFQVNLSVILKIIIFIY